MAYTGNAAAVDQAANATSEAVAGHSKGPMDRESLYSIRTKIGEEFVTVGYVDKNSKGTIMASLKTDVLSKLEAQGGYIRGLFLNDVTRFNKQ